MHCYLKINAVSMLAKVCCNIVSISVTLLVDIMIHYCLDYYIINIIQYIAVLTIHSNGKGSE